MTAPAPPPTSGFRWKVGVTLALLILSIPVAVMAGASMGAQLMQSLHQQVDATLKPAEANASGKDGFSPYGIADSTQPGTLNDGSVAASADTEALPPQEKAGDDAGKILEAGPEITMEAVVENGETVEPLVDPASLEGTAPAAAAEEETPTSDSIFNLKGDEKEPELHSSWKIIVGTFGKRESAETYLADLQSQGYHATIVTYEPDEEGNPPVYRVVLGTYKDRAAAASEAEDLRRRGFAAWLLKD